MLTRNKELTDMHTPGGEVTVDLFITAPANNDDVAVSLVAARRADEDDAPTHRSLHVERAENADVDPGMPARAGVEGELHQVGANIIADALDADGWDVRFLGTNMPHRSIIEVIEAHQPTLLGISASIITNAPRVHDLIAEVRERFDGATPAIFVGGGAFRTASGLWQEVGADTFAADVGEAVAAARETVI